MSQSLNLIPPSLQRAAATRRVKRVGSRAVLASGVVVSALLGLEWTRGVAALRDLTELDARYAPLARLADEQEETEAEVARLRAREQIALRLAREAVGLPLLGAVSRAASAGAGAVYLDELTYDGGSADATQPAAQVRLRGVGIDGVAVAQFVERLRESRAFEGLAIESSEPVAGGAASVRQFLVTGAL